MQNLSVAMGNMERGIEFPIICPTAADAPGAACGIGLYAFCSSALRVAVTRRELETLRSSLIGELWMSWALSLLAIFVNCR
jgi:hypothetical protein